MCVCLYMYTSNPILILPPLDALWKSKDITYNCNIFFIHPNTFSIKEKKKDIHVNTYLVRIVEKEIPKEPGNNFSNLKKNITNMNGSYAIHNWTKCLD